MGRLDGKTALVAAASRGIGRAIAIELAREGAKVALNYLSSAAAAKEAADQIGKAGGTCLPVKANLADPREARGRVKQVAEQFGHLDILVINAGSTRDKQIGNMTDEEWLEVIQTNLNGVFFWASAAIPIMTAQSYGRIVNISPMNGQVGAFGQANCSASKGGVIACRRTAAVELARSGITVNSVSPGYTETDMFAKVPADVQAQIKAKIPLRRFAQAEKIARAVVFLVAGGDYVTGQMIGVNGGANI